MTLDKHFSEENPFSQFSLSQIRVSIKTMKTKLIKLEDGSYKEIVDGKYTKEEMENIRMEWGAQAMEAS